MNIKRGEQLLQFACDLGHEKAKFYIDESRDGYESLVSAKIILSTNKKGEVYATLVPD